LLTQANGALLLTPDIEFPATPVLSIVRTEFVQTVVEETSKLAIGLDDTTIGETDDNVVPHAFDATTLA
jgi:hypothetical protein